MSRIAQLVQQQVNEMRRKQRPQIRRSPVHDPEDDTATLAAPPASTTDVTDELATPAPMSHHPAEGAPVAKTKHRRAAKSTTRARTARARKPTNGKSRTAKAARSSKTTVPAWAPGNGLPVPAALRLAKGGIAAGDGSTIRMAFANGYAVTLKVGGETPVETRDHLVGWLRKRLGAERA